MKALLKTMTDGGEPENTANADAARAVQSTRPRFKLRGRVTERGVVAGLSIGLFGVCWLAFGERLMPSAHVRMETVLAAERPRGAAIASAGELQADPYAAPMALQASGWFEADPYAVHVTALVSGVIDRVEVLEGERVTRGQVLARFVADDFEWAHAAAQAQLEAARAAVALAQADQAMATARLATFSKQLTAMEGRVAEQADMARRARAMGVGPISEREIAQAGLRLETLQRELTALRAQQAEREAAVQGTLAQVDAAQGRLAEAQARAGRAALDLERTVVRAPMDGIVQRLLVAPGRKRMLAADALDSATIAVLYDPAQLQARIDVPLAEAAKLRIGQAVTLQTEYLPDATLRGVVTRIVGEADLQRNTLQVKVALHDADERLRPEMLCRARFLESMLAGQGQVAERGAADASAGGLAVYVREAAVFEAQGERAVWVLAKEGQRAALRSIELGAERRGEYRRVQRGLRPGDRVILAGPDALREGQRVRALETTAANTANGGDTNT